MSKVQEDLVAFSSARLMSWEAADKWKDDLIFMLVNEALVRFEFQVKIDVWGTATSGVRYTVHDQGSWFTDNESGGLDLYGLPQGARVEVVIALRSDLEPWLRDAIAGRGYTLPAMSLSGTSLQDRSYISGGYGVVRELFGDLA